MMYKFDFNQSTKLKVLSSIDDYKSVDAQYWEVSYCDVKTVQHFQVS